MLAQGELIEKRLYDGLNGKFCNDLFPKEIPMSTYHDGLSIKTYELDLVPFFVSHWQELNKIGKKNRFVKIFDITLSHSSENQF